MSEYTRKPRSTRHNKKHMPRVLLVVCLMLVVMVGSIAGTVAWLTATTEPVTNTFTVGDINITLAETTGDDYKFVPGVDISKDPKATVKANSEECYLFVKVDTQNWPSNEKISYSIADGWTALTDVNGVYYREVSRSTADQSFAVIKDNKITVSGELTKTEAAAIKPTTGNITMTFTAYAVQKASGSGTNFTAAEAWARIPN